MNTTPDGPSFDQLRDYLRQRGISASEAGRLVGINGRTMRRYTTDPRESEHARRMPWSNWALLRLLMGDARVIDIRAEATARGASDTDGKRGQGDDE